MILGTLRERLFAAIRPKSGGNAEAGSSTSAEERSINNPTVTLNDADTWLTDLLGGGYAAGVAVNGETALGLAAFWRAVNLLSRDVAKLPLEVYRRRSAGGKDPALGHPARRLLRRSPNERRNVFSWKLRLMQSALLAGNGYAWIERDRAGRPIALWELPPQSVSVVVTPSGNVFYELHQGLGRETVDIAAAEMVHVRCLEKAASPEGIAIVDKLRDPIGLGLAQDRYGGKYFSSGARPAVILKPPEGVRRIDPAEARRLESRFDELAGGVDKMFRALVVPGGFDAVPWTFSNEQAEFLESRAFTLVDVANAFGVPPHKLGAEGRTSYASLEEENRAYLEESLDPWLVCIEAELEKKLLSTEELESEDISVRFRRQALLRANATTRGAFYSQALTSGWMSRDEVRDLEDLNPIPDGSGAQFLVPVNQQPSAVGGADEDSQAADSPDPADPNSPNESPPERPRSRPLDPLVEHHALGELRSILGRLERRIGGKPEADRADPENRRICLEALGHVAGIVDLHALEHGADPGRCETLAERLTSGITSGETSEALMAVARQWLRPKREMAGTNNGS